MISANQEGGSFNSCILVEEGMISKAAYHRHAIFWLVFAISIFIAHVRVVPEVLEGLELPIEG